MSAGDGFGQGFGFGCGCLTLILGILAFGGCLVGGYLAFLAQLYH